MSTLKVNAIRSTSAGSDAITLDGSGNITLPGNLTVSGTHNLGYDDSKLRRDINILALRTAIDNNKTAHSLNDTFIDIYEDDTGLQTQTTVDRDDTGEYVASVIQETIGGDNDPFSKALSHGETTQTNHITGGPGFVEESNANANTNQHKFGSKSWQYDGNSDWHKCTVGSGDQIGTWEPGGGDFTLDFWWYPTSNTRYALYAGQTDYWFGLDYHMNGTRNVNLWASSDGSDWDLFNGDSGGNGIGSISCTLNAWNHIAAVRNGNNWMTFINGVKDVDETVSGSVVNKQSEYKKIGEWGNGQMDILGHIDEWHWRKGKATWTANFTPPTQAYPWTLTVANATGTLISSAQTASSARTKVSGVMLYKNNAGTTTIGTDLKIYFTCNGGSNWTEAASYTAASDFSTGVKTVYLGETTCTSGTDVRYKAVWANQAASSKETQLHGMGMNY